ncbi:MAG: hypothetical protein CFH41_01165 [Alphaproteobacteria bacterium MarineAlpha11_Bin1]|nr:MAG: hypothetical protein CFH41_01165 [Alphaproteobacteria bacterium MarineAlpha11_Bin1]|tara:strand:- start:48073 stop:48699 length:627 start_codon:yes stop_codon:yes gene_type:complete
MKRTILYGVIALSFLTVSIPLRGEYFITAQDKADIARVEEYLNSMRSLRSKFMQYSSGNQFAEGNIYIKRPKKVRLQYIRPPNIQVYANGFWLAHVDTELNEVAHVPLELTPAGFLVGKKIELSGDVTVRRIFRSANTLSIEIFKTDEPEDGKFVMAFAERPLSLRKWVVTDAQGVSTSVILAAPEFNVMIPDAVFEFDETKFESESE